MQDIFFAPISTQKEVGNHPDPKPLKLWEQLIEAFSDKNDVILDPFAGSGTTLMASFNLKRNCICIESNPKYCNIIKERCFGRKYLEEREEADYRFEVI